MIHWYKMCFFGAEDTESREYDMHSACITAIKTEIPPEIDKRMALQILFGKDPNNKWLDKCVLHNLTHIEEITESEARKYVAVSVLKERIEDPELGVYYKQHGSTWDR